MSNKLKSIGLGILAVPAVGIIVASCGNDDEVFQTTQGTVIQNATVVNTRDGSLTAGQTIVVDGGKILRILPNNSVRIGGTAQAVDASGKYVVPGFLDMHTHVFDGDQQSAYWPLMISNGITGVREMTGTADLVARARKHNADRAAGTLDAPEVTLIPGDAFRGTTSASTTAGPATAQVHAETTYAPDFIKILVANREAILAILAQAKIEHLDVAGHLTPWVSARESSDMGYKAIEHLGAGIGILLDCSTEEDSVRAALVRGEGGINPPSLVATWQFTAGTAPFYQRVYNSYDAGKCQTLAQTFAKNGTWHVPTLIRLRTQAFVDTTPIRTDSTLLKYVHPTTRAVWEAAAVRFATTIPASASATYKQYFEGRVQTLPALLKQNNVKMLAGSDLSSSLTPWIVPGFSLHQEFALLAANGLKPLDILQMTTLNPAEFLNRQSTMGTVDEGKNADLVLLDANPIQDAANLDKISGVFLRGKYFSKDVLATMQSDVATTYRNTPAAVVGPIEASHSD